MATIAMREVREGEVPSDGGRRSRRMPAGPCSTATGPDDYVCVQCGNLLAEAMDPAYMTKKVRVRCGRCRTVNVAVTDESRRRAVRRSLRTSSAGRWRS